MPVTHLRNIYQLKITLTGSKPPIWRRILVSNDITLDKLHLTLQIAMGWTNSHLHQFISNNVFYGIKDDDFVFDMDMDIENEDEYKLNQLLKSEKDTINYEYDFGDGWEHKVILEKILPFNTDNKLPCCTSGKRSCPPEDCGGIWGYQDLIDTLNDSEHPEHESMLEWLGGGFDPEAFDIKEINKLLLEYVR
ncbi:MAG: plasmid pRiA4b ORF-3 family protein [Methylococcales bacterium]|nr:plasmid pRiA4b ORF-3 family protein [Methylococcales bacterium]